MITHNDNLDDVRRNNVFLDERHLGYANPELACKSYCGMKPYKCSILFVALVPRCGRQINET